MYTKPEHLVVDTTAFIQNASLQEMGTNISTIQEVVNEITSKRQLRRLVVLPYELKIMNVFPENIQFITEFSKKTGDYRSLSATDIKLMALVYQLEKQYVGTEHLKSAPTTSRALSFDAPQVTPLELVGFHKGGKKEPSLKDGEGSDENPDKTDIEDQHKVEVEAHQIAEQNCNMGSEENSPDLNENPEDLLEGDLSCLTISDVLHKVSDEEECESEEEERESEECSDDDSDWITPDNVRQVKQLMDFGLSEDKAITVGCVTTDFAMQNVLKQIGLNVVGLDGRVIKHLRTFIFRCYACFKTTSNMTKVFCPNCGNKTLKKVAVSVDENGQQKIHINPKKPLTQRGKRFSLPKPQGGKHANNPILCEDQPLPDQRPTRLARTKTNPLDDDYIAGFSPFVMRDVNSKSAMLGIRGKNQQVKYWMRKNPNEVIKHGKKKK